MDLRATCPSIVSNSNSPESEPTVSFIASLSDSKILKFKKLRKIESDLPFLYSLMLILDRLTPKSFF